MGNMNYQYFKTAKKTAEKNNFAIAGKTLFDFSLLDETDISDIEKEIIRDHALKCISPAFREDMYGKVINQFHACDGIALYNIQRVFSKTSGKHLYNIFILSGIKHYSKTRKSVYDKYYDVKEYKSKNNNLIYRQFSDIEL